MKIIFVLRSLIGMLLFIFVTVILSVVTIASTYIFANPKFESKIIKLWGRIALALFGVKLEVRGLENIPQGSGLFIFNHSSFFDIFAMVAAFSEFRYGAKIELFKLPFFGKAMRKAGVLPIARQNREETFKVYQEANHRAQNGEKFALAPEGGRNYDDKLLPFKAGPFIFAINSNLRLIPTVIQGAHQIMHKGSLIPNVDCWQRKIRVSYLPVIDIQGVSLENRSILQKKAFLQMNEYISQNPI